MLVGYFAWEGRHLRITKARASALEEASTRVLNFDYDCIAITAVTNTTIRIVVVTEVIFF